MCYMILYLAIGVVFNIWLFKNINEDDKDLFVFMLTIILIIWPILLGWVIFDWLANKYNAWRMGCKQKKTTK